MKMKRSDCDNNTSAFLKRSDIFRSSPLEKRGWVLLVKVDTDTPSLGTAEKNDAGAQKPM